MIPSPQIQHRSDDHHSCWLSAGSAHARIGSPDCTDVAPPIRSRNVRNACSLLHVRPSFDATRPGRSLRSKLLEPHAAVKSP